MKFIISGKNIDVTPGLKATVEDKIGKLEKYFTPETEVHATLSVEKERQKIEVTIPMKGNIIRSEQVSNDMYISIDLAAEVIERQLKKFRNKFRAEQQAGAAAGGDAAAAEEKTEFDVELTEVGPNKVKVIKVVREATGLGLKEAKDVVDGAPKVIKEQADKATAEDIKAKLEAEGAKVTLK